METWRKELYLAHHGIKGQRRGVRKGPPYPLSANNHTAAEKKAGWRQSLSEQSKHITSRLKRERTPESDGNTDGTNPKRKRMSSKTKKVLATTATVAALGVIGAVAVRNPKVRALAASGAKTLAALKEEGRLRTAYELKGWDPQFEKGWREAMLDMERTERRAKKAEKRDLKARRRAQKKENDEFWKQVQKSNRKIAARKRKEAIQKRINTWKFNQQTNALLREDARRKRKYADVSSAELLNRARRSKYTHS